jgi:putative endopeptidase
VGDFYKAAMDTSRRSALGLQPLAGELQRIAAAPGTASDYGSLAGRLQDRFGSSPLINAVAMPDAKNSSTYVLALVPGSQLLEQDEYTKPESQRLRDFYRQYIVALLNGAGDTVETAGNNATRILVMESRMAAAMMSPLQMREPANTYNMMTLAQAQDLVPALNLRAFLKALGISPPQRVQVVDVQAMKALQRFLADQPADDVKLLMRWHTLSSRAAELGGGYRAMEQEFTRLRRGLKTPPELTRVVTQQIGAQLYHPLSQLYVQANFPDSTRREITEMVGAHQGRVRQPPAQQHLAGRRHPQGGAREAGQDRHPGGLPGTLGRLQRAGHPPDDHFGNVQRAARFAFQRDVNQIGKPVLGDRFAVATKTTPIAVNSAYNFTTNTIDITAAILQPPFYKPGADAAANYCAIGAVIGHEITHGFDSLGRQYDAQGNLRNWWTADADRPLQAAHRRAGRPVQPLRDPARPDAQRRDDRDREHRRPGRHHAGPRGAAALSGEEPGCPRWTG